MQPHLVSWGPPAPPREYPHDVGPRRQLFGIASGVELGVELRRLEHLESGEEAEEAERPRDKVAGATPVLLFGRVAPGNVMIDADPEL